MYLPLSVVLFLYQVTPGSNAPFATGTTAVPVGKNVIPLGATREISQGAQLAATVSLLVSVLNVDSL